MEELGPDFSAALLGDLASDVPTWSLASEIPVPEWSYEETTLVATVRCAWQKPLAQLTGHEFRTLVSQGFGLAWLAGPALEVVERYPSAYFSNYEGELAYAILSHAEEMHAIQASNLREWLNSDLSLLADLIEPVGEENFLKPSFRELLPEARQRFG